MIRKIALCLILIPALSQAQTVNLAGVPENCQAPLAHDMMMANIPAILELDEGSAHIAAIQTLGTTEAYQYQPGLYRLDCYVNVRWSNGTVDWGYKFSTWESRYGRTMVSYGHR